jgi:DNA-binding LacI/PurR family transcriptional regulator
MKKTQPTLYDIAKELNISVSTVSRALNNHPAISVKTKNAVLERARKLNYEPNLLALSLLYRKTNIIGIIVPEITSHFFSMVISGVQDQVNSYGYNLIVSQSNESVENEIKAINTLFLSRVDGFIISPSSQTCEYGHLDKLKANDIPLVIFDRDCEGFEADKVLVDDYSGAFEAVKYLIKTGCKRIAHITGPKNLSTSVHRLNGYLDALKMNNIEIDADLIIATGGFSPEFGVGPAETLIHLPNPPDAIFVVNDGVAFGAMHLIKERGLLVPDQISIIGFDDEPYSSYFMPSLTSVRQPVYDMGMLSARILLSNLMEVPKKGKEPYRLETFKPELVIRDSCKRLHALVE